MMRICACMLAATAALSVSACVSLLPETTPAKPRYQIAAIDARAPGAARVAWSLAIDDPRATRAFDTTKIAVSTAPGRIEYYAGAEWADRAPRLFQTALIESFEDSGRILGVGDRAAMPVGDYVLQADIRRIVLEIRDGKPAAVVHVYARLTDGKGAVHAAKLMPARIDAQSDEAEDVLVAFSAAFRRVLSDTVRWTFDEGVKAPVAQK